MRFQFNLMLNCILIYIIAIHLNLCSVMCMQSLTDFDLDDFSPEDIRKLMETIENRTVVSRKSHTCVSDLEVQDGMIIRSRDSMKNGAKFLGAPVVDTLMECKKKCCNYKGERLCDLATFQNIDDNPSDQQPKCFLFSCVNKNGEFACETASNSEYIVLRRKDAVEVDQLLDIAMNDPVEETTQTDPITTTTMVTTSVRAASTAGTKVLPEKITITTSRVPPTKFVCSKNCSRLQWKCDNGCCIKVNQVCNKHPDCEDASDEIECEFLSDPSNKLQTPEAITKPSFKVLHTSAESSSGVTVVTPMESSIAVNEDLFGDDFVSEKMPGEQGAVLPLALGLSVTACVLLMVACRLRIMKKKLYRRGKPLTMEESDYLINGMYL